MAVAKFPDGLTASGLAQQETPAALAACQSRLDGLTPAEAAARLEQFGPNRLPRPERTPWYIDLALQFVHLFALLLWVGSALAWVAGMPELAWAIVAVILINGLFSYWQQYKAERAIEALESLLPIQVTVRRAGRDEAIAATQVVVGDVLVLSGGDAVPADARLLNAQRLRLDMSALTGESRPAPRDAHVLNRPTATPAEQLNCVFAGSGVVQGRGEAVVFATAGSTEFGRIARLTQFTHPRPSPIERELIQITRLITLLSVAMGVAFFVAGTWLGELSWVESFLFGVGILVANVPEGLLPTLTLSLAYGVRRMAQRKAVVKHLPKVEALGATTVIVTDKTGTLTENQMTVRAVWTADALFEVTGTGYDVTGEILGLADQQHGHAVVELLRTAALCCDAKLRPPTSEDADWRIVGDPTEAAILVAAHKAGLTADVLAEYPRRAELPFDSVRKRMTTVQHIDGRTVACVKGAPSEILGRCIVAQWSVAPESGEGPESGTAPQSGTAARNGAAVAKWTEAQRSGVQRASDELASRGWRVLAVACRELAEQEHTSRDGVEPDGWRVEEVERDLTFLGLVAMEDPPRPAVPAAIAACRGAGIRVLMATGDSGLTGAAIGREIGLLPADAQAITGAELDRLDDEALSELLTNERLLFARVAPQHKLRLVEALQRRGEVVAVTGDGVNDAPALKRADVGVAMGRRGAEVAREAADVVLTDDNFATIVAAVEEGRAVFANVRKFLTYILASNVPEIVPFVAMVLWRIPLPLTVMQVLAVDLGTDLLPALALGAEPPEPDLMRRKPRRRNQRLLNRQTLLRAYAWLGIIEATMAMAAYFASQWLSGWRPGKPLFAEGLEYRQATTLTLAAIVACQVGNVLACRSDRQSILHLGLFQNRAIWFGIAAELAILATLVYVPALAAPFGLAPPPWSHAALLAAFPVVLIAVEELRKVWAARR